MSHINGNSAGTHPSSGWFAHDHPEGDDSNEGVGQTRLLDPVRLGSADQDEKPQ